MYISTLDLEDATTESLLDLVRSTVVDLVKREWLRLSDQDVHRIRDARDRLMYSLTFVTIVPD